MQTKVTLINLGCPKNLVDSEIILGLLKNAGFEIHEDITKAQVMLINTCSFIKDAKEESIELILELARIKNESKNKYLVVIGCLVQRYLHELAKEMPEVDLWVTLPEIPNISKLISGLIRTKTTSKTSYRPPAPAAFMYDHNTPRLKITPSHYSYVKIAEGCSNCCTYCAVPHIKGRYQSRQINSIITEVKSLIDQGTKEINLIAQDTTSYGMDLKNNTTLTALLRKICCLDGLEWLRLLYTHPAHVNKELVNEIAKNYTICNYIDLPLQHISDEILTKMGRKINSKQIKSLIAMMRHDIPNVVIRTSFIVGFPGETEKHFSNLLNFMEEIKFERLGIFTYSNEDGTLAYDMPGQIPERVKNERFHKAMQLQQEISKEINKRFLSRELQILIEGPDEEKDGLWYGRSYADAPEVDGQVYISSNLVKQGDIIRVKITDTMEYDLVGEVI